MTESGNCDTIALWTLSVKLETNSPEAEVRSLPIPGRVSIGLRLRGFLSGRIT